MVDVDSYVRARLESDCRHASMLKLLGEADVSLWGINQANEMYIREGHLEWDPMKVVQRVNDIAQGNRQWMSINNDDDSDKIELAKVIRDALSGKKFPPALEHQDGDRHFRTRFMADFKNRQGDDETSAVEAILALTYETTEIKRRSMLQLDNERLAMNEKAATEASKLKSGFLANVSLRFLPRRLPTNSLQ